MPIERLLNSRTAGAPRAYADAAEQVADAAKKGRPLQQYIIALISRDAYTLTRTGVVYDTYSLLAPGTARIKYDDAVSEGLIPLSLVKEESGQWKAVCDMSAYPDTQFRFEMWNHAGEDDDPHEGNSASGLSLSNIYLVKE